MFRERLLKYGSGIYDSAAHFNRNIISMLRALNGGLGADNVAQETIKSGIVSSYTSLSATDHRGPAPNDRTLANRQAGGWTQGTEYVIGARSGLPYVLNSVSISSEESVNLMVHWNGECAVRNTGRWPFRLASITLLLDGEKIPGGTWHFTDRFTVELDAPWDNASPGLFRGAVATNDVDNIFNSLEFLQSISTSIVMPPGEHIIEAVLTVDYRNKDTGDFYDLDRPDTNVPAAPAPEDWVGYLEHPDGHVSARADYRARTFAVYSRSLSVYGFTK